MTRQAVVIVAALAVAWIVAAAAGNFLPQIGFSIVALAAVVLVGILMTAAATVRQVSSTTRDLREELERTRAELKETNATLCRAAIDTLLSQFVKIAGRGWLITRSSVFLIGDDERLQIVQHHNMLAAPDRSIKFGKYQGCVGQAWGRKEQIVGNLPAASDVELSTAWGLTPEQIALNGNVKSILSTPIWFPGDVIVGILNIDSDGPLATSGLDQAEVMNLAAQTAEILAGLLELGEIISTDRPMERS